MAWKVDVYEYERGWGSRLDFTETFATHAEAKTFQKDFNARNVGTVVPDWYMVAYDPHFVEGEFILEEPVEDGCEITDDKVQSIVESLTDVERKALFGALKALET